MHRLAFFVILLASFALAPTAFAGVDEGDKPSYTATALDGTEVSAAELRGKVVLVDFWATWCAPCKESFPFYSKLVDKYDGDLVVLAVSVDGDKAGVRQFLEGRDFAFTVIWNKKHPLAKTFGPSMFPTSYVIDRAGVLRHVHTGFDKEVREETAAQIEALMDG